MEQKDFLEWSQDGIEYVEIVDAWQLRVYSKYGDYVDIHSCEDGFDYTHMGEYFENRDTSQLMKDFGVFSADIYRNMVAKYGQQTESGLMEILSSAPMPQPQTFKAYEKQR